MTNSFQQRCQLALTHPVTLAAVALLLVNDWLLKPLWQSSLPGGVHRAKSCEPPREAKSLTGGDEPQAKQKTEDVSGRSPLKLGERLLEVARDKRTDGAKAVDLIADGPARRLHGG